MHGVHTLSCHPIAIGSMSQKYLLLDTNLPLSELRILLIITIYIFWYIGRDTTLLRFLGLSPSLVEFLHSFVPRSEPVLLVEEAREWDLDLLGFGLGSVIGGG